MLLKKLLLPGTILLFSALLLIGCKDDVEEQTPSDPPDTDDDVELESEINEFVWNAMNEWYYFREDVPTLEDSLDDDQNEFYSYLNDFSTPEDLFNSIKVDDFSDIVDDYEELGGSLQAVYNSFGYDFVLAPAGNNTFVGFIRYVFPDSEAEKAGLERGDAFIEVDGEPLKVSQVEDFLSKENYTLTIGKISKQGDGYTVSSTGEEIVVNPTERERSAIWVNKTFTVDGKKVGYLFYSNFAFNLHKELNDAFGNFKSEGIDELILDLRYNPGGSVLTAIYLNSMIHSNDRNKLMGSIEYNSKKQNRDRNLFFTDDIRFFNEDFEEEGVAEPTNTLNLNNLYIITSNSTASASEFVINALRPYMNVTLIGDVTVGKNVGSISLYDNPDENYTEKEGADPDHTYGLQPIVSKIANSQGFTDYEQGFDPDVAISEGDFLDDLRPLGDENEQMLAEALSLICTTCLPPQRSTGRSMTNVKNQFEILELSRGYQVADLTGLQ